MRQLFATLTILSVVVFCAAGSPDAGISSGPDSGSTAPDRYTLAGRIENMPSVEGSCTLKVITKNDYMPEELIASSSVSPDGSFSVDLPGSLDDELMAPYFEKPLDDRNFGPGVAISNIDLKCSAIRLEMYAGDEYLGEIRYGTPEEYGHFFYFDADCDITGSHYRSGLDINLIYTLNIKKGWNWIYGTQVWNGPDGNVMTVETKSVDGAFRFFPF